MGICSSSESTAVATAKLILNDGTLQEFSYPVKVSYILQKNPSCFICNSDEMDFDDALSAISDEEELQLGQLYFALPLSRLKQPLQAEEMAALAVKANSALMKCGAGDKCSHRRRSVSPVVFAIEELKTRKRLSAGRSGAGGRNKFAANLTAIPE
ncbi:uncharacterized protein LOC111497150 [Cucurbita maxima]|uniref:Uncharacterized protein LOC111497150 n=1 Tax=Cucurbita maxima TaxID=3661 RepID=A0A6J1KPP1_CUCMA|nr:uncharacterized protein LOC111497150 [Cucurbita maxima]